MTRGTPSYATDTITGASATAIMDLFLPAIESEISGYQSNSTAAWETYETLDSALATRDRVYRSVGDRTLASGAGDTSLFFRIERATATTLNLTGYQDWSTSSSTGARATNTVVLGGISSSDLTYYISVNEYEIHIAYEQSGTFFWLGCANPNRIHVPPAHSGVAFATGSITSGSAVVIATDRSLVGSVTVGQNVWITNRTASGNALETSDIEILEIEAVSATPNITLSPANNYASGAIIGVDPIGLFVWAAQTSSDPLMYSTHDTLGLTVGSGSTSQVASVQLPLEPGVESGEDPHAGTDFYIGQRGWLFDNATTNAQGLRGELDSVAWWGLGTQTGPADRMIDLDSDDRYAPFTTLTNAGRILSIFVQNGA